MPPQRPPIYPEEMTPARPEKKPLLLDQGTQTEKELEEWSNWLDLTLQGKSVIEHGVTVQDIRTVIRWCEALCQFPRGGSGARWRDRCHRPDSVSTLLYLQKMLRAARAFLSWRLPQPGGCW